MKQRIGWAGFASVVLAEHYQLVSTQGRWTAKQFSIQELQGRRLNSRNRSRNAQFEPMTSGRFRMAR